MKLENTYQANETQGLEQQEKKEDAIQCDCPLLLDMQRRKYNKELCGGPVLKEKPATMWLQGKIQFKSLLVISA